MPLTTTIANGQPVTYEHTQFFARPGEGSAPSNAVRVQFLGVNSIYITDGATHLMIDPFFSRMPVRVSNLIFGGLMRVPPNRQAIQNVLSQTGIQKLDAMFFTHAHWDHALDVAEVWRYFAENNNGDGGTIYGDNSIRQIAIGGYQKWQADGDTGGLPNIADSFMPVAEDDSIPIGDFTITILRGSHINLPLWTDAVMAGHIEEPVVPPARVNQYKQGEIFSILIKHSAHGSILNQGSANYVDGYYLDIFGPEGRFPFPDVLMPGIAGFNSSYLYPIGARRRYYNQVVNATRPKRVLLTHWDEFQEDDCTLDHPLVWKHDAWESYELLAELRNEGFAATGWEMVTPQPRQDAETSAERGTGMRSGGRYEFMRAMTPTVHFLPIGPEIVVLPATRQNMLLQRPVAQR
ncbi:MAG: MBL fold metallo-hydrolase [Proteobacteria bacterium]|nr:MBL fold metallo-hydrolase [Pseudomonadota bacterium]